MLNLEPEIVQLHGEGLVSPDAAAVLIADERREIVSLYAEIRVLAWVGVMLIATGVGIIVSKNLDRIGPIAIASTIGIASAACYAYSVWRRARARHAHLDEYVLLLGALLLSADVGYIEHQFNLLGSDWPRHFLLLALVHGATAYYFESAALLSLSVAALASWLGIERRAETFFSDSIGTAMRAFVCAGIVGVWRIINRRVAFELVFDHFIANLALWGGLILTFNHDTRVPGAMIVIVLAVLTIAHGFRKREEFFVIYAYVYAVIAIDALIVMSMHDSALIEFFIVISTIAAIVGLFVLHLRFREAAK